LFVSAGTDQYQLPSIHLATVALCDIVKVAALKPARKPLETVQGINSRRQQSPPPLGPALEENRGEVNFRHLPPPNFIATHTNIFIIFSTPDHI
jgi:hypothetical protein